MKQILQLLLQKITSSVEREAQQLTIQDCYHTTAQILHKIDKLINPQPITFLTQQVTDDILLVSITLKETLISIFPDSIKDIPADVRPIRAVEILSYQEFQTFIDCLMQFRLLCVAYPTINITLTKTTSNIDNKGIL